MTISNIVMMLTLKQNKEKEKKKKKWEDVPKEGHRKHMLGKLGQG